MASTAKDDKTRATFMETVRVWFRLAEQSKVGPAKDETV